MSVEIFHKVSEMLQKGESVALVSVVDARGSVPGKVGFKLLVDKEGNISGTVGGGPLEAMAVKEAQKVLAEGTPRLISRTLDQKGAEDLGMVCGGEITLFIDVLGPSLSLVIVGAGHISQPLSAMGKMLGFAVTVLDDREDFCNKERFPSADHCLAGDFGDILDSLVPKLDQNSYVVIVTRGHSFDQLALEKLLQSQAGYLGMIGSRRKVNTIIQNLEKKGIKQQDLQKVHAPVGLSIGAQTPEEIAVSILAEIVAVKNKQTSEKSLSQ